MTTQSSGSWATLLPLQIIFRLLSFVSACHVSSSVTVNSIALNPPTKHIHNASAKNEYIFLYFTELKCVGGGVANACKAHSKHIESRLITMTT